MSYDKGPGGGGLPPRPDLPARLIMQVTPLNPWFPSYHTINAEQIGMAFDSYGVHFGNGEENLEHQHSRNKAVLSGSPIRSPAPNGMPDFRRYSVARVRISYPEGYETPFLRWIVRFHVFGSSNARAAIYSGIYYPNQFTGILISSVAANGLQQLQTNLAPPSRGRVLSVYLFLELAPNTSATTQKLDFLKTEFLTR